MSQKGLFVKKSLGKWPSGIMASGRFSSTCPQISFISITGLCGFSCNPVIQSASVAVSLQEEPLPKGNSSCLR